MLKKCAYALVSVFLLIGIISCGNLWFGALEGFEFEANYKTAAGLLDFDIHLDFETGTTGTLKLGTSAYILGGWMPHMYETWEFTYEYDFNEEAGTIRRSGESAIQFTTRQSPPNLEVVLQNWPESSSNAVLKMVVDAE
ncbi:hypothetical protein [Spirochaeta dissipatitropha]